MQQFGVRQLLRAEGSFFKKECVCGGVSHMMSSVRGIIPLGMIGMPVIQSH